MHSLQPRDGQLRAGADQVGVGDAIGRDDVRDGDAEFIGDDVQGVTGLDDVDRRVVVLRLDGGCRR